MDIPNASTISERRLLDVGDWEKVLSEEVNKSYFKRLAEYIKNDRKTFEIYPPVHLMFRAFELTPFDKIKVVIVGQDPYHGEGQADGLAFSVPCGLDRPPSLRNIYKEVDGDNGNQRLDVWAEQGVFLMNSILTVRKNIPGSHSNLGWETFTDHVIKSISDRHEHLVFMLWGRFAQNKKTYIDVNKHLVLETSHPSPLSAHKGFLGCGHFTKCNQYLELHNKSSIKW